jgi:hypothetical protein
MMSAPEWRFPRRMTFKQWSVLPYRERHAYLARAQCTLLEYWRDCANARCRRARRCLVPQPCYWERKQAMPPAEWARAEAACRPLRALLSLGSLKGSEGCFEVLTSAPARSAGEGDHTKCGGGGMRRFGLL